MYLFEFIQTIFRQLFCRPPDDTFLVNYETLRRRERTNNNNNSSSQTSNNNNTKRGWEVVKFSSHISFNL